MCGFTGFWHPDGCSREATAQLAELTDAIVHRGPDDSGVWVDPECGVALGFRRLAIVDLSHEGHQPMKSAEGRYQIVFNGEIYNHRDIRRELENSGCRFRGHSDTEVILAAVEKWGPRAAVEKLVGMFAIALWDRAENELHLIRDRLGEKPLYWGYLGKNLVFGSELKALRRHPDWDRPIDRNALTLLLRHGYIPAPRSIYEGISKVTPGVVISIRRRRGGLVSSEAAYWDASSIATRGLTNPHAGNADEIATELSALLQRAVDDEVVADVPVGAFLSGGVDSSLIVALMQRNSTRPVKTFTIGFTEEGFDEAPFARAVADYLGTDHTELYISPSQALSVIPRLPTIYDEPFADSSQIPTFLVSELARRTVTVSLSGDGGDELFGGYSRYRHAQDLWGKIRRIPAPARRSIGRAIAGIRVSHWDAMMDMVGSPKVAGLRGHLTGDRIHKFARVLSAENETALYHTIVSAWTSPESAVVGGLEPATPLTSVNESGITDYFSRMMWLDQVTYLPDDILVKVDRASMAVSLESRAPFLDHRVVEFAWRIPEALRFKDGRGKWILRHLLDRYVPRALIDRPKAGFAVPVGEWLRGPLRDWASDLLDESKLTSEGYFDPRPVRRLWNQHQSGNRSWTPQLWSVLMFQAWLQQTRNSG